MTEITTVKNHEYFIDEQRFGPYSLWHHRHHFYEIKGGVKMTDEVNYKLPFGVFGDEKKSQASFSDIGNFNSVLRL